MSLKNKLMKIPCMLIRGGTSKGAFFLKENLPNSRAILYSTLLKIMDTKNLSQINGIGGGGHLSNKIAILSKSNRKNVDVNYFFVQLVPGSNLIHTKLNCGNILSAVAPFAIENKLIETTSPKTTVRIFNTNTNSLVHATIDTPKGVIKYNKSKHEGDIYTEGAVVSLDFKTLANLDRAKIFPTGNPCDIIDDVKVSCLNVAVPLVVARLGDFKKTSRESKNELTSDYQLLEKLEKVRQLAAKKMGFGNVEKKLFPKFSLISYPNLRGDICSRYFTPFSCHDSHAVTGGICLAVASKLQGTVAHEIIDKNHKNSSKVSIEHFGGQIDVFIESNGEHINSIKLIRTARPLFHGEVYVV